MTCNRCKSPMVEGFYCLRCGYVPGKKVKMYSIYRYFEHGDKQLLAEGLTLEEVKEHCNDPETHGQLESGERWFEGFVKEGD